jgi:hypothetical protein
MADPFIGIVSVLSFDDRRIVCEEGEIFHHAPKINTEAARIFLPGWLLDVGKGGATYRRLWNLSFVCHTLVKSRQNPLCVADKR